MKNLGSKRFTSFQKLSALKNILNNHGVIGYPTETVFGIGCDPFDDIALKKLLAIKGRDSDKGLLVLIGNINTVSKYAKEIPDYALKLIEKYWPGSVTFLFKARDELSPLLVGGQRLIGLRISSHPIASFISSILPFGIVSTSANKSGEITLTCAKELQDMFGSEIDFVVDGSCQGGIASSVVDCSGQHPILIRKGEVIPVEAVIPAEAGI